MNSLRQYGAPVVIYILIDKSFFFTSRGMNVWSLYDCGAVARSLFVSSPPITVWGRWNKPWLLIIRRFYTKSWAFLNPSYSLLASRLAILIGTARHLKPPVVPENPWIKWSSITVSRE